MDVTGLSQPEDTVSISLLAQWLLHTICHPPPRNVFLALDVGIVLSSFYVGKGILYSLHVDQLWFSGGTSIYCKKKFL